jgi:hypothetical protein
LILAMLATSTAIGLWMIQSQMLVTGTRASPAYVFGPAPLSIFLAAAVAAFVLLTFTHSKILGASLGIDRSVGAAMARTAYAAPLSLLALLALPLLLQLDSPPAAVRVLSYFLFDLRDVFVLLVLAACAFGLGARLEWTPDSWVRRPPTWLAYCSLGLVAIAFGLASSPPARFESVLAGDEPRYLRYAESFYQGHGIDISQKVSFDRFVPGSADRGRQFLLFADRAAAALTGVFGDAIRWVRGEYDRFAGPRSRNSFIKGKDGGIYQLQMPALATLLYPFYYVDRVYLNTESGSRNEFPKRLLVTGTAVLALYVLWGAVIYRFLVRYTGRPLLSWALALTGLTTIPIAPFNFQYYPEVAAGIIVWTALYVALFGRDRPPRAAFVHGVLLGLLPWLHVRFLIVSLVCASAFLIRLPHNLRTRMAFAAGYLSLLGLLGTYFYDVTGSVLPTAMYALSGHGRLDIPGIRNGLAGLMLDRTYGILPYSPIYVLAFLGLWPVLSCRQRGTTWLWIVAGSLVLLAAAYVPWFAGSSTPARLIVAVVPFALLPLAHAFLLFGKNRIFAVVAGLLLVVSIHNAFAYNAHLNRAALLTMTDESISGWKSVLLFPTFLGRGHGALWPRAYLVAFWLMSATLLTVRSSLRAKPSRSSASPWTPWSYCALVAAVILILSAAAGVLTQSPTGFDERFIVSPAPTMTPPVATGS